ncbi:hypothetical protein Cni_G11734 [Canna indica]|uniref:C3H1-type domain-containing protein n=1 Tax=Canna indica TaxID=4628 RepID=A0AAQ3Q9T5_9LILI|nr:hypothetical protein Cni_G11734 [Canna indica]
MENLIALQTLNPQERSYSRPVHSRHRRSHLDSASYRTLVRIFSLCLDESLNPPREACDGPTAIAGAATPDEPDRLSAGEDSIHERNDDGCLATEAGCSGIGSIECGSPRFDAALEGNPGSEEKSGDGKGVNAETVSNLVPGGPQLQIGDVEDKALHKTEEPRLQHEDGGEGVDVGLEEGPVIDSMLETSRKASVCLGDASESPINMISDCSKSLEVKGSVLDAAEVLQVEDADGFTEKCITICLDSNDQVADLVGKSDQRSRHDPEGECINETSSEALLAESNALRMCSNDLVHDIMNEGHNKNFKSSATDLCPMILKSQQELSNTPNELVENNQQKLLDSSSNNLMSNQPFKNLLNSLLESDSDEEVEEGQIPDDFWNSDESGLMVHQNAFIDSQKLDEGSSYSDLLDKGGSDCVVKLPGSDCSDKNIISRDINSNDENLFLMVDRKDGNAHLCLDDRRSSAEMNQACSNAPEIEVEQQAVTLNVLRPYGDNSPCRDGVSVDEDVKVKTKRKRGPLTEERKAKKKKAKRRKRAEKEREQGVRRLKLKPVVKPKVVKICNYYLVGRCQQGDMCKFSHDATPVTKSQPCKYFACDSCLKGDDCPFDHQLSKYPCHNIQSKGSCHRGDRCKFSHKIPPVEGSSITVASNLVSSITAEKLNVDKLKSMNKEPANVSSLAKNTTSTTAFVLPKKLEGNSMRTAEEPMRIPNGIHFISFGNGLSESMKRTTDNLLLEKHGCNEQSPQKTFADKNKNADVSSEKSLPKLQSEFSFSFSSMKTFSGDYLKSRSSSSAPVTTPLSKSLQSEVSDASKILEEFLFTPGG